ncbi:ABC transporter permease [Brevibacterium litoralis]|uniref:ABC transporter permease n=1 Tax=Brevibacterium litoralis TaxID=3138935 RepID=UPI0032EA9090
MIRFLLRRLLSSALVLLVVSFAVYMLLDFAMDYFEDLRTSTSPNVEALYEARIRLLDLETPVLLRYFGWLGGAAGCVIGQCDLGTAWVSGEAVTSMIPGRIANTVKLVTAATFIAILLGMAVGLVSAIRQYSGFDYLITFFSFLMYSLPIFWVAVLLKQYGAIEFNNFLRDPSVGWPAIFAVTILSAIFWTLAFGGGWRKKGITFGTAFVVTFAVIYWILATGWIQNPQIGILGVAVVSLAAAVVITYLSTGLGNRRALYSALATAVLGIVMWYVMQWVFWYLQNIMNWGFVLLFLAVAIALGMGVGLAFGGPDKWANARTAGFVAVVSSFMVFIDRVFQEWTAYGNYPGINGRPIATIGASLPNIQGNFWFLQLDTFTHLLLPSIALILISFASYTRYTRGSMLEVMNHDYIRTARAKGLSERTVIMRHALRNALMPLASIIPVDIITMIGGAVITETIFGWNGMGKMFIDAMNRNELDPVMAYILITGILAIVANLVADFLYAVLDPRIRVAD